MNSGGSQKPFTQAGHLSKGTKISEQNLQLTELLECDRLYSSANIIRRVRQQNLNLSDADVAIILQEAVASGDLQQIEENAFCYECPKHSTPEPEKKTTNTGGYGIDLVIAQYFYRQGFNVSAISETLGSNSKKAPYHKWQSLLESRQHEEELFSYQWDKCSGIGAFAGINDFRCIDFDGCNDVEFIHDFLKILGLPFDYEWLIRSGSNNGFHIWLRCKDFPEQQKKVYKYSAKNNGLFSHLELRRNQHIVLPPSLHESGNRYKFLNVDFPQNPPADVAIRKINEAVKVCCQIDEGKKCNLTSTIQAASVDEYSVFEYAVEFTTNKIQFSNGSRNNFVHQLACNCNRYGVPLQFALSQIVSRYEQQDFKDTEIVATVLSAYTHTQDWATFREAILIKLKGSAKENESTPEPENPDGDQSFCSTGEAILSRGTQEIPTLLDPIFPQVGLVAIAGGSDVGKSAWLRQFAIAVSVGDEYFLGWKLNIKHHSVIYITTEDDELAINYLLNKQTKSRGLPPSKYKKLRFLFDTTSLLEKLDKELSRMPADCVIIDAFTDLYSGSLNQTNEIRNFLNKFKLLADRHRCLVIFLHHTGKKTEDLEPSKHNLLGSQGFEAKMRLVIELRTDADEDDLRHLCLVKGNYLSREYKQSSYVLRFDENMLFHITDDRVPFEQLSKADEEKDCKIDERTKKILKAIELRKGGMLIQAIADELRVGKGTISKWLSKFPP